MRHRPRTASQIVSIAVAVAAIGVAGSLTVWHTLHSLETDVVAANFRHDANERMLAIRGKVETALETLQSLASLYRSTDEVDREEFREFTGGLLERHKAYVQAFGWNRRVTRADREEHERATARAIKRPAYEIRERSAQGRMVRARPRDEYVAVSYLEPYEGNEEALGYDIASERVRKRALDAADASGELTITAPVRLVQDDSASPYGFLACIPIGREGFVVGAYRAGDIVRQALDPLQPHDLAIRLRDGAAAESGDLFARAIDRADVESGLFFTDTHAYGERAWTLEIRPTPVYLASFRSWTPLVALLGGLLVTALLTAYVAILLGRSARVAALVAEGTEELTRVNHGLEREVAQRERAEAELTRHRDQLEAQVRKRTAALSDAVAQLQESEERQRLTLDAIADGAWDWNVATGECRYSAAWLSSLGYQATEVEPHVSFREGLMHPEDRPKAMQALAPHLEGRTPCFESRVRVRRKDGAWRWSLTRGRVVARDDAGHALRMLGTDTDISERIEAETEQRAMEQRLQHSQKLESLGVLAGGIAHDFNNLLVVMLGGAELALQSTPRGSAAYRSLENIRVSATRAAELTEQMLAYAGRNAIARRLVELPELVEEMARLLRASKSKKADLRLERESELPPVEADPTQIRQVVMNLITNASDAIGDEAGTITIRLGSVDVGRHELASMVLGDRLEPGRYVSLEVADSGSGMDEETVEKMFDPFFTTKFQGRGLGLAAVLGIIRSHGGAIHVASRLGQGTTFRIVLPPAERPASEGTTAPRALAEQGACTILLIDDEKFVRGIGREMLEGAGFRVIEAEDGLAGIDALRAHLGDIALVILDMTMPRMSGIETIRELHRIRPDLPVVFSSGYSKTETAGTVEDHGAVGFIQKPYGVRTFLSTVHAALRSSPTQSQTPPPE